MTGAVPANARRPAAVVNRAGSSPISARTRAAKTGPSPGAERRMVARGWRSNSTANMMARWYNTDTGQFDTRDTVSVSPLPDSVRTNRFQYGDANPLTTVDPTGHWGWSSLKKAASSVAKVVTNPVSTFKAVASYTSYTFNYVSSGRAWKDAKSAVSKAKKAWNVVKDSTTRWAKKKFNAVKDAYNSAKKCMKGGARKCIKETAKKAVKKTLTKVQSTVEAIKKDPWKFVATAAAGLAAAVAVGALCATGVGCSAAALRDFRRRESYRIARGRVCGARVRLWCQVRRGPVGRSW